MSYKVDATDLFIKRLKPLLKKYASLTNDLQKLEEELARAPRTGSSLGQNCYKVRLSIKSKQAGKSGGARVITLVQVTEEQVLLLTIYDKAERADLHPNELHELLQLLEE
ncbi:type II toxin-antitoxin system RelE/ParE family toxin [Hymenobacter aerophilus]|uniref:type II toxin-antitoxin system RelE/ParE family toxin n=1 Tax=Hymenobacter aerophilus TaxID=119644 RepID=UPI000360E70A|nr:type II toxin-antitoxin system RelE/ParE family toxin [Hymenobacter aerophilus]